MKNKSRKQDMLLSLEPEDKEQETPKRDLRDGDRCPNCSKGILDYDGLLNLECPSCGYTLAGCFT